MIFLLSLHRHNKYTYSHIIDTSSRPVVKLRGFFLLFLRAQKKTSSVAVCVVGETRISNCATDEEKFSNNKFMDLAKVTKFSLHLQRLTTTKNIDIWKTSE